MREWFHKISVAISVKMGSPYAFILAVSAVLIWALSGPIFKFSQTWQLLINTGTTIMTFLMIFLVQNTQNRDGKALQLKLDELIRASTTARDEFVNLEAMSDEEIAALDSDFQVIGTKKNSRLLKNIHSRLEAEKARRHHGFTEALKNVVKR